MDVRGGSPAFKDKTVMWGRESFCKRNVHGIQEWQDGCKYEGEFVNNLKHGTGVFIWPNGEVCSVFKDYRHGKGLYSWPDGSKYTGKFYLNRKEGYRIQVNCHDDVIHMLLDSGADVNKLNDEGMSALAVCHVLYYPLQSLHETLAERVTQNISPEPKQGVLQLEHEQDRSTEEPHVIIMSKSIQVFDDKIPLGSVSWREKEAKTVADSEQEVTNLETDENLERSIRSDDPTFDSACSMASFHIDVTEEILQKSAEILHRNRWTTIKLLLERGADPNASTVPMPVIFLAIKAAHVKGVHRLLECGASIWSYLFLLFVFMTAKGFEPQAFKNQHVMASGPLAKFSVAPVELPQEGGRTPLHVACQRDSEYAVDELLAGGADPNLPLTRHVGSALCALANISYDRGPHPRNQVKLLEKLIKAGADILMPVVVGEGRRCAVGIVVDYAHCAFQQNQHMAHTPYHALNKHERQAYNTCRQLLGLMGDLLRQAGLCIRSKEFVSYRLKSQVANLCVCVLFEVKQHFKYCYECGRSVGVQLSACSRCREVFYCSKTCKTKAWDEHHRDECVRFEIIIIFRMISEGSE
uniref:Ankyrin repeat and MYND domain containing 1 n=1 Tax=Sinocyclocheilus rhinocerous TaxID=307959 RepID=A0A673NIK6_9TELE